MKLIKNLFAVALISIPCTLHAQIKVDPLVKASLLADINQTPVLDEQGNLIGTDSSMPNGAVNIGSAILFTSDIVYQNRKGIFAYRGIGYGLEKLAEVQADRDNNYDFAMQPIPNQSKALIKVQDSLFITDGTARGTVKVFSAPSLGQPLQLTSMGSQSVFLLTSGSSNQGSSFDLWSTDGTPRGTKIVTSIQNSASMPFIANNKVIYTTSVNSGTSVSTVIKALDIQTNSSTDVAVFPLVLPNYIRITLLASVNNRVIYSNCLNTACFSNNARNQLWSTDGTPEGTFQLKGKGFPHNAIGMTYQPLLAGVAPRVFYAAYSSQSCSDLTQLKLDLWASDGTENGTQLILANTSSLREATFFDNKLAFIGPDTVTVYLSDGTTQGTTTLFKISTPSNSSHTLVKCGSRLYASSFIEDMGYGDLDGYYKYSAFSLSDKRLVTMNEKFLARLSKYNTACLNETLFIEGRTSQDMNIGIINGSESPVFLPTGINSIDNSSTIPLGLIGNGLLLAGYERKTGLEPYSIDVSGINSSMSISAATSKQSALRYEVELEAEDAPLEY